MKRIIVGLFILSSLFMFTSCGHEHDFGEVKIIKIATCTETGLKESKCKTCGEIKTEELNRLEHVYESDNDASTETGVDVQVCILCGEKIFCKNLYHRASPTGSFVVICLPIQRTQFSSSIPGLGRSHMLQSN